MERAQQHKGAASLLFDDGVPSLSCFHSRQTIERTLKALAYHQGDQDHLHSHDLVKLLDVVVPAFGQLDRFRSRLARITDYYIQGRYPGHEEDSLVLLEREAEEASEAAGQIYEAAEEVIFGHRPDRS